LFGRHLGAQAPFLHLSDGTTISHDAFLRLTARYAHAITGIGLSPGDRLAVQIGKSPEALAVYAACVQTGVIFLPLNTVYTAAEVDYFVGNSGARLVLTSDKALAALTPVATAHGAVLHSLNADGSGSFADAARGLPERFDTVVRDGGDLAALLYTSGTTGRSKGAMLTQTNLLSNAQVPTDCWRFTADDVLLHALGQGTGAGADRRAGGSGAERLQGLLADALKTAEESRADGFFVTGDLGLVDEAGYVQIVGRDKDLIISGGYNIYPKEVEMALDDLPGVLESGVVGAPHPDFGESVVGILVAEPGAEIDTGAVMAALSALLARFKQPRYLAVVDALPRNTMGKVQKNLLRDRIADVFPAKAAG